MSSAALDVQAVVDMLLSAGDDLSGDSIVRPMENGVYVALKLRRDLGPNKPIVRVLLKEGLKEKGWTLKRCKMHRTFLEFFMTSADTSQPPEEEPG